MRVALAVVALAGFSCAASAECVRGDYAQYKDKALGPDGVKALALDLCTTKIYFKQALNEDVARATLRDPASMKYSNACMAEMQKIIDAAKAAGVYDEVSAMSKTLCPGK